MSTTIKKLINWRLWLHGLVGATVNSAATAISAAIVIPDRVNLGDGLDELLKLAAASALLGAALYLKKSPVPPIDVDGDGVADSLNP